MERKVNPLNIKNESARHVFYERLQEKLKENRLMEALNYHRISREITVARFYETGEYKLICDILKDIWEMYLQPYISEEGLKTVACLNKINYDEYPDHRKLPPPVTYTEVDLFSKDYDECTSITKLLGCGNCGNPDCYKFRGDPMLDSFSKEELFDFYHDVNIKEESYMINAKIAYWSNRLDHRILERPRRKHLFEARLTKVYGYG